MNLPRRERARLSPELGSCVRRPFFSRLEIGCRVIGNKKPSDIPRVFLFTKETFNSRTNDGVAPAPCIEWKRAYRLGAILEIAENQKLRAVPRFHEIQKCSRASPAFLETLKLPYAFVSQFQAENLSRFPGADLGKTYSDSVLASVFSGAFFLDSASVSSDEAASASSSSSAKSSSRVTFLSVTSTLVSR